MKLCFLNVRILFLSLFIEREREREREGERQREGDRESQTGSVLSVQSLMLGLIS